MEKLIFNQIPLIIEDIEAIKKKKSIGGGITYAFRGIDAFMNALNPLLAKYKVTIAPEVIHNQREVIATNNGGKMNLVVLTIKYTFYAQDGSSFSTVMIGESFDSGDKASNKAQSIALKYCLMQVFMVPTEDIEDPDKYDTSKVISEPKKTSNPPPQNVTVIHPKNPVVKTDTDNAADYVKQDKTVTEAQLKRLFAMMKNSSLSEEDIKKQMKMRFNKESTKDLNMVEYDQMIKVIEANPKN